MPTVPAVPGNADPDEAQPSGLFYEVDGDPPSSFGVDTLDSRLVGIDLGRLDQAVESPVGPKDPVTGKPTMPQTLALNLFNEVVFTGIIEHVEPTASGHALWGRLDGVELGTMTMVVNGKIVVGTVRTPNAVYTIRTAGDGTYVIRQIDESSLPPLGEPLEASPSPRDTSTQSDDIQPDDGSVIDVMVVYTALARRRHAGRAAIEALIDLMVAETNQAYANSGVIHRIRLVLREEVDYIEEGVSSIDLQRLRDASDGYMDHVHQRRDLYAADLVHILVGKSDFGGRAHVNRGDSAAEDAPFGFGLTASYAGGLVLAHELGHNMGLHHDRYEVGVPRTGYHYGYVNQRMFEAGAPESARWRTIMAYGVQCWQVGEIYCERLGYFSNPEKTLYGDPMGVAADNQSTGVDGPADGARSLNERRQITANFRRSSSSPTPRVGLNLSPYWLSERGGTSRVTATLHRVSSADTTVTVSASPSDAVRLSRNGVLTIPAGETVSRGAVTITGVNNGTRTGDVSVTISATTANSSSLGVVAPEPVELAIADDETRPVVTLSLSPPEIPEIDGRTFVSGILDNRSGVETTVTVSATPSNAVQQIYSDTLVIPPGQRASDGFGASIYALDDDILTEAQKSVTVSGTATNTHGVTGPESVTLTIIDDEAPYFAHDSITYSFTEGVAGGRFLPEAAYGNGELTYSLSPSSVSDLTFTPGPPAQIGVPASLEAGREGSYTLTATDADGDSDTMTIIIGVREGVCPNSAAVAGYSDPEIVNDCEALLASRDALSIERTLNWDKDLSIEEWEGVDVGGSRVVGLRIVRDGIVGTIPSELGSLSSLRTLSLWGNQLTGGIPKELGSLTNLQTLNLNENRLTGEIPKELGSLAKLQWLNLLENRLTGEMPTELGNLAELRSLDFAGNQLTGGIPTELGDLSELIRLSLSGNRLTGEIPAELENLPDLQELYLRDNLLTGCVPDGLRDVPNNDFARLGLPFCVDLACSTLTGASNGANNPGLVSDCIALLTARDTLAGTASLNWSIDTPIADWSGVVLEGTPGRVTELRLRNLGLNGEIPPELGSLSDLQHLNLSDNNLTGGIPTELGGLSNLQELYLSGNGLSGCVPDELRDIPSNDLASLGLPFCSEHPCVSGGAVADATNPGLLSDCETLLAARDTLAGTAALNWVADTPITEWDGVILGGKQQRVASLDLNRRELTGEIPTEFGNLTNLTRLLLYSNGLTGEIPKELGDLADLRELSLYSNRLTGEIPKELGNLANLQSLFISNNQFTGEIPAELGNLANLHVLSLSGNRLNGEIPPVLGNLTRLRSLYISGTLLRGEIPTELENLDNLQTLWLGGNQLTGGIPKELGNLANLQSLLLSSNELTDEIPTELGNLDNLTTLNVSDNRLTGEIPAELGNLDNLKTLNISKNQLTGEIPTELGNLDNLKWLYLNDNDLTGEIPTELGNLDNLKTLALSSNQLTGIIPTVLGNLANLQTLWLGGNRLTSGIPKELGNLADLRGLYLGSNRLTGQIPTELGRLNRLVQLLLSHNDLEGSIPASLGNLRNLERLWLSNNRLTGCVPPRLRYVPDNDFDQLGLSFCVLSPPDAPTIGSVTPELDFLAISWSPPLNDGGSDITAYDLRHIETSADETVDSNWTVAEDVWTPGSGALEYSLTGLTADIEYDFQVRAVNAEGDGSWSETVTGTPSGVGNCATDGAVPDAANNPELVSDCTALLTARDALAPPLANGEPRLNWSSDTPIVDWDGIGDDSLQGSPTRVTRLYLNGFGLDGTIPSELSNLSALRVLHLHDNELSGTIPSDLGDLLKLNYLYAHNNDLTGSIPAELGGLASLRRLFLHSNDLTGSIPAELGKLKSLTHLWLKDNDLTGVIPAELGDMSSLDWLHIAENDISGGIPAELGSLTKLRRFYVYENDLSGPIPGEFGSLTRLTHIVAQENDLSGELPEELGNLTNLVWLGLYDNDLEGEIPEEMGGLAKLQRLYLHHNELSGEIPEELGELSEMTNLWLNHNYLSGQIPESLGALAKLSRLRLAGNGFTGCLPAGLVDVSNSDADELGLETCSVTSSGAASNAQDLVTRGEGETILSSTANGTPASTTDCSSGSAVPEASNNPELVSDCNALLTARDALAPPLANGEPRLNWSSDTPIVDWDGIGDDSLQGSPTRVTRLYLNGLGLDGTIPSELSNLSALRVLHLHDNELTGTIPSDLGGLTKLNYLYAHNNDLTGEIPAELGGLASLRRLYLHSNDLTGSIPAELGKLKSLTHLWLKDNDLTGVIPAELGDMSSLDWLHIAENDISGGIPAELGSLTKLRRFYVYENDLSGPIPGEFGSLTRLTHIVAQENDLSGELPEELGNLTNLVWLGLYDNDLEGEIPEEMGGLTKLQRLYLHHNELSGEIPEELGELSEMTNLWLNHNYLSGQIPVSLGALAKLTRLRLAGNVFTGCLPAGLVDVSNSDTDELGLETCSEG